VHLVTHHRTRTVILVIARFARLSFLEPRPAPPRSLIACALVITALISAGCKRRKPPPTVQTLQGESASLPRLTRVDAPPSLTRASERMITSGGKIRRYTFVEPQPQHLRPTDTRYPLVLVFHGDGGDASGFHEQWPFERASGKDAFVAYLDGIGRTWDLETTKNNPDEIYAEAVVNEIASTHAVDLGRVFATGYSSGGFMANVLACHRPGFLRAIASNAGGAPFHQLESWSNGFPKCPGQQPVAMLALHGGRDWTVSSDSGRFSAEYWAYVNGCKTEEMETTGYAECTTYRGCPTGKAVGNCFVPALAHWVWEESAHASWTFFQRNGPP
jgi:polyhydroxybutyrate depolymerase